MPPSHSPNNNARRKRRAERPTAAERRERQRILYGGRVGRPPKYDPEFHPDDIVAYFQEALNAIEAPERVVSTSGIVKYVQAPVPPPTLAGYAAKIDVARETLWDWGQKHEEFSHATKRCKAIQEQVFLQMGALGAYAPSLTALMMKNLLDWQEKIEHEQKGPVILNFDADDANA